MVNNDELEVIDLDNEEIEKIKKDAIDEYNSMQVKAPNYKRELIFIAVLIVLAIIVTVATKTRGNVNYNKDSNAKEIVVTINENGEVIEDDN